MSSMCENAWLVPHTKLEGISLMDHLFGRMNGMYPNKWRANFRDEQAIEDWKTAWAEAFDEDGITPHDVADGIRNCRRMYDWPPSLPEFLRACRPQIQPEIAFHEAVQGLLARQRGDVGQWDHPAVFYAAVAVGAHDMLNATYNQIQTKWGKALADQLARTSWETIPAPAPALPAPGATVTTNAEGVQKIQELAAKAIQPTKRDHKAWARKILEEHERKGGRRYSVTVLDMARRALAMPQEVTA